MALIALAQMPPLADIPAMNDDDPIVVTALLSKVRFFLDVTPAGKLKECRITRSSGEPVIDQIGCDAARLCLAEKKLSSGPFATCIKQKEAELLADLVATSEKKQKTDHAQN